MLSWSQWLNLTGTPIRGGGTPAGGAINGVLAELNHWTGKGDIPLNHSYSARLWRK